MYILYIVVYSDENMGGKCEDFVDFHLKILDIFSRDFLRGIGYGF